MKKIKNADPRHYAAILAEAQRVGWPKRFMTDVTKHDRAELLKRNDSAHFGWAIWEDGSFLFLPTPKDIDCKRRKMWQMPQIVADTMSKETRFYYWNGSELRACADAAQLAEFLHTCVHCDNCGHPTNGAGDYCSPDCQTEAHVLASAVAS